MAGGSGVGDGVTAAAAEAAFDNPEAYIPRDRRRSLATGVPIPDRARGAAIFADISGFTPLTEALATELGPQRGAEELTASLGRVFHAVIAELDRFGGDVIYFSGDAITCWIDGDDGLCATACGLAMQQAMARVGTITTPAGSTVRLAVKVAVAVGSARRFLVGDPEIQLIDVLAGRLIDDLADAEHHTEKGEVVLEPSALQALGSLVTVEERVADDGRVFGVVQHLNVPVADHYAAEAEQPLSEDVVRQWLLPSVYERLRTGRGEFLAELRPAYPVFLRFGGINYDDDADAIAKLDDFVRKSQQVMHRFGGNVLQLTLGDKGAYLYGVFGSPLAHEDDAARAAAAVLELATLDKTTAARGIQVGVTYGQLRSGTYGHAMRRTFVCLGDAVNLSARLMSAAPEGAIFVTREVRDSAGDAFLWEELPPMQVKGKSMPITPYRLTGSLARASRRKTRFELPLIGRQAELARLDGGLEEALQGRGRVLGIAAEAGMGKSRLVAEFVREARRRGQQVVFGECEAFGTKTGYFVWREIWRRLLGVEDDAPEATQIAALEERLREIDPALVARAPLLDPVLGIAIPDTELTRSFDAKLRKTSLEDLLAKCLRVRSANSPLVVVLEDCHWIDELSRDLLGVLVRAVATFPVLFVLAYRPAAEPGGALGIDRVPTFAEMRLDRMEPAEVGELIRSKMAQLTGGGGGVSDALVHLIAARSEGNPFYVEELLNFIAAQGVDTADPAALEHLRLPESLHSLILSRIDAAAAEPRRTLKVASVVGRTFRAPTLTGAYTDLGAPDEVNGHLDALRTLDLINLDREADAVWIFKHAVTQDVAYESLPFALRGVLHGLIGDFIERTEQDDLERLIPLLEHHYWRSDRAGKKREYLRKAAEQARAAYANAAAISYFERLVPLLEGEDRVRALLSLGKAHELTGNWPMAGEIDGQALALAAEIGDVRGEAECQAALADVARKQGRLEEATERIDAAKALFSQVEDDVGIGVVLHLSGTIAAQQGRYDDARARYLESLTIRERHRDTEKVGRLYVNLAIVAEYSRDFAEARRLALKALDVFRESGDRWLIALTLNNMAVTDLYERRFDEAAQRTEESVALAREVGDPWLRSLAMFNLGKAMKGKGDVVRARTILAESVRAFERLDDPYDLAEAIEDVAVLTAATDPVAGFELLGAANRLRADIGAARAAAREDELTAELAAARASLGEVAVEAALARGRELDQPGTIRRTLELCA